MNFGDDPISLWCYLIGVGVHLNSLHECGFGDEAGDLRGQGARAAIEAIFVNDDVVLTGAPHPKWLNGLLGSLVDWPVDNDEVIENAYMVRAAACGLLTPATTDPAPGATQLRALGALMLVDALIESRTGLITSGQLADEVVGSRSNRAEHDDGESCMPPAALRLSAPAG